MKKEEILAKLKTSYSSENLMEVRREFKELSQAFYDQYNKEQKALEEKQLDLSAEIEVDQENNQLNQDITAIIEGFRAKFKAIREAKELEEKNNLVEKKSVLKDFESLLLNEENIGTMFGKVKEIRERWKVVGSIPQNAFQDIQSAFSKLNEEFNYNINIYKELKENDLKRNYSLKNKIVHDLKLLLEEPKIKTIEKSIKELQSDWEEIGPTFTEHWEKLKEEYWTSVKAIYDKIKVFYQAKKEEQKKNLESKQGLVAQAKQITATIPDTHKIWEATTKKLSELQQQWKKTGYAPKEVNDTIWEEFRSYFNTFFEQKSDFYKERNEGFDQNKTKKQHLVDKANEIIGEANWKLGTQQIIKLQDQWKKIGHAGKFAEQKLWATFREKCDAFFDAKSNHFKEKDQANEANLKQKRELVEEIKSFKPAEDLKANIQQLKTFSSRFNGIGNVPFKEKDKIYKAYKEALDQQYDQLKIDKTQKAKMQFEAKLDQIKQSANPAQLIQQEKEKIRRRINDITKEVAKYENNLGFFSVSKGADSLLKGVKNNIEKGKTEIQSLKDKLRGLDKTIKQVTPE